MNKWYAWLSERDGYVVAAVSAALNLLSTFGVLLSNDQMNAINIAAATLLALILGRSVKKAE